MVMSRLKRPLMLASIGRRWVHRRISVCHRGPGRHPHPTLVRLRWLCGETRRCARRG